jgi:predicted phosphoribosyltransferase
VAASFTDRRDAGRRLAETLQPSLPAGDVVILGLPRGGIVVAAEVARATAAPLDVLVVRKLGVPYRPELAMGAVGEDGIRILDVGLVQRLGVSTAAVAEVEAAERLELERRVRRYRGARSSLDVRRRTVVVVDDGFATGATARVGCRIARARGAARVVLAVPVAPQGWERSVCGDADDAVAVLTPSRFAGVGQFYRDFHQVRDDEVIACLGR